MKEDDNNSDAEIVDLNLGKNSYQIYIAKGILDNAGKLIHSAMKNKKKYQNAIIITDSNVGKIYEDRVEKSLAESGIDSYIITIPAGEKSKSLENFQKLIEDMLACRPDRNTMVIALGGGVVGDIAGFAASVLLRGVPFIQIPTSLLAQVDSSVGGKTAINSKHGKNLIGSFYQPKLVIIDIDTLNTLPKREFLAGYAEVVKYALIGDKEFFDRLIINTNILKEKKKLDKHIVYMIKTCCKAKAAIVEEDEKEQGRRALLNLGHTFGHALEKEMEYNDSVLIHGEAVALGLLMAHKLSEKLGLAKDNSYRQLKEHFQYMGLPTSLKDIKDDYEWNADNLLQHCYHDKKVKNGKLTFILTRGIGKAFITQNVTPEDVREIFFSFIG